MVKEIIVNPIDDDTLYYEMWDSESLTYIRTNIFYKRKDTGVDPFMRRYPNLIDVGVMGFCSHGANGLCSVGCYQSGNTKTQKHMSVGAYETIMKESEGRVLQVALGGRGDPNKHPHFADLLRLSREHNIVPNYTTSGYNLTQEEIDLSVKYCGGVAVSWYRAPYTLKALDAFCSTDLTVNIHYVLSKSSLPEAVDRLEKRNFFGDGHNRMTNVVFLMHKPVGNGSQADVLDNDDPLLHRFFNIIDSWDGDFGIGFDSCGVPGIINHTENIDRRSTESCEGARFSMYITPDMIATPCSFDQELKYGVDLKTLGIDPIKKAWLSPTFESFRNKMESSCPSCPNRTLCYGGCPLKPEIVLCDSDSKQ